MIFANQAEDGKARVRRTERPPPAARLLNSEGDYVVYSSTRVKAFFDSQVVNIPAASRFREDLDDHLMVDIMGAAALGCATRSTIPLLARLSAAGSDVAAAERLCTPSAFAWKDVRPPASPKAALVSSSFGATPCSPAHDARAGECCTLARVGYGF